MLYKKLATAATFMAAAFFVSSCNNKPATGQAPTMQDSVITVTVATAGGNTAGGAITASGQVEALQTANISTRVMGYITKVYVKVGDAVNQGQLLFTVNSTDIQAKRAQTEAAIAQAEAAYSNAQKDYDRYTALYKQQSASAKELDNITLQYNSAKAAVEAAKQMRNEVNAQLQYTSVTAPFAGLVTQKLMDAGNMATPGMPVLAIEQQGSLQVSASIPETQVTGIKQGGEALVNIKSINKTVKGSITQISPSSQFTGGQYIIKISLPGGGDKGLYAGMYVNVSIPSATPAAPAQAAPGNILVPVSCLVYNGELAGLYTVGQNKQAMLRWLRLGKTVGDKVEVLSGLDKDEPFIVTASGRLYNGAAIQVK
jgi:RND family efflux transporter MFP subunit